MSWRARAEILAAVLCGVLSAALVVRTRAPPRATSTPALRGCDDQAPVAPPRRLDARALERVCANADACVAEARQRLRAIEWCYERLDKGCPLKPDRRIFADVLDLLIVFLRLPLGQERSDMYSRIQRLAPRLPWAGDIDCAELASLRLLWREVPSVVPKVASLLDRAGALNETCARTPKDLVQVPRGFASFLASEPARLGHMQSLARSSKPVFISTAPPEHGEQPRLYPRAELMLGGQRKAGPALIDTGAVMFIAISPRVAQMLGVTRRFETDIPFRPCMYCDAAPVVYAWIDSVQLGGVTVSNIPAVVVDQREDVVLGLPFLQAAGGLTVRWPGPVAEARFGPPVGCTKTVPSFVGFSGVLWMRSALGELGGNPLLAFDTGIDTAYILMEDVVPVVPSSWTANSLSSSEGPNVWDAPAMPSPRGADPRLRTVTRAARLDPAETRDGSDGFASHLAFTPRTTCVSFDPPSVRVAE